MPAGQVFLNPNGLRPANQLEGQHHVPRQTIDRIWVKPLPRLEGRPKRLGIARAGPLLLQCVIGRGGIGAKRLEGDGVTPVGRYFVRRAFLRRDRERFAATALPCAAIVRGMSWCDRPFDRNYNRLVGADPDAGAETLRRDDNLYDVVMVVGFNDLPRVQGRGSAIFIHRARGDRRPSEGCLAFGRRDLLALLKMVGRRTVLVIER